MSRKWWAYYTHKQPTYHRHLLILASKKFHTLSLSGKLAIFILAAFVPLHNIIHKNGVKLATSNKLPPLAKMAKISADEYLLCIGNWPAWFVGLSSKLSAHAVRGDNSVILSAPKSGIILSYCSETYLMQRNNKFKHLNCFRILLATNLERQR